MNHSIFDRLKSELETHGPLVAAQVLVEEMRREHRYSELFEALKMVHRIDLGLPAVQLDGVAGNGAETGVPPALQDELDRRLIESCKEVGSALLQRGSLQEGWMYMRAVGDREATAEALREIEATPENLDMLLGLLVQEGIDVKRGTELSLEMRGTCNTITMMDSVVAMRGRADQQVAVGALVEHLHQELLTNVVADLARRESWPAEHPERGERSIEKLLQSRPTLLNDGSYHLDTTHIASVVRFARVLDDLEQIRLALDIAEYGKKLHAQYQYPSDEPFADLYPMSIALFKALLGEQVDGACRLFLQKAESLDVNEHGPIAIETYADLLTRLGRPAEAMEFLIRRMPPKMRPFGIAPSLIELATLSGNFELMKSHASERLDTIGFAAALLQEKTSKRV